jgi:hypothetical protein
MLQQNWALIDERDGGAARVFFVTDLGGVFDEVTFPSKSTAELSLSTSNSSPLGALAGRTRPGIVKAIFLEPVCEGLITR